MDYMKMWTWMDFDGTGEGNAFRGYLCVAGGESSSDVKMEARKCFAIGWNGLWMGKTHAKQLGFFFYPPTLAPFLPGGIISCSYLSVRLPLI